VTRRTVILVRAFAGLRGSWGVLLLAAPATVVAALGRPPSTGSVTVIRVLGARQVVQAVLTGAFPTSMVLGAGAVVDALHALTGALLGKAAPRWRHAGLADATLAAGLAGTGWWLRTRSPHPKRQHSPHLKGQKMTERRVAVVTGGTAGVGRAVVRELAAHGWDVAVLARGRSGLEGAVKDVERAGGRGLGVPTDVADLDQVRAAAERAEKELGPIELWVNDAFSGDLRYFWDIPPDEYRRITEVTYFGQVHGTRVALEHMRPRNRGVIVQVGSALGFRGIPLQAAYCGAKHAVKGFTETVITELKHEGSAVRVCMVQLPGVNTVQFDWNATDFDEHPQPVPPIFQPEIPARAVRFLADHPRRNMWVGFSTAYTILGNRVAPWFLDWYLARKTVKGQLTEADGPRYGSNVFAPKDEDADRGAHGMFDAEAKSRDIWSWSSMHRVALGSAAAVFAASILAAGSRQR
jgi:NAD(P)-dependent dehydrogenase (short-subunit alcohol dehydrogenase family)